MPQGKRTTLPTREGFRTKSQAGRVVRTTYTRSPNYPATQLVNELSPSRLLVRANPKRDLADELVREQRIRRMEPAGAAVAEQPLELALLEHAEAARKIERPIDDVERRFHSPMLDRKEPHQPVRPDPAFGPVGGDRFDVWPHRLEIHRDLGDAVLHFRVVDHRSR